MAPTSVAAISGPLPVVFGPAELAWLWFAVGTAVVALAFAGAWSRGVLAAGTGTPGMREVGDRIRQGAGAYLRRQFGAIALIVGPLVILVALTAAPAQTTGQLTTLQAAGARAGAFLAGCALSGLTGYVGMQMAVRGNVRTAAAARRGSLGAALAVAFRTGGVVGMVTVGLGLLGVAGALLVFRESSGPVLLGLGLGASLLALFMRVGGGVFTKAADVGADLVGKLEEGIPEDDPRNPATIADNVGDNVGDCAGMVADLFESYQVTLVAAVLLGAAAFRSLGADPALGVVFPLAVRGVGVVASVVGVLAVRLQATDRSVQTAINRGSVIAGALTLLGTLAVALSYVGNDHVAEGWRVFAAVAVGVLLGGAVSRLTEHWTSIRRRPVREIADATATGPATTVLSGVSVGLESSVWAVAMVAAAILSAVALGGGNLVLSLYLVALIGVGMLATTGVVVAEDTYGPVVDNAAGITEMSGESHGEAQQVMAHLDAVGNTTKAVTKGFAIGSAVVAAVGLFGAFVQAIADQLEAHTAGPAPLLRPQLDVADPTMFAGLLVGGSMAFLFSAVAIRAVSRTAGLVVDEVRHQFRERRISQDDAADYDAVIDICARASLRELVTPAALAALMPVIVGFTLGPYALGAFLVGAILTGYLMASFLTVAGGAWDNAKKYIEAGNLGGKGSPAHTAAVIGDTIGDPFKDTAGPGLNPLIKVMNLVALLLLPVVIRLQEAPAVRIGVAAVALAAVLTAVLVSSAPRPRRVPVRS